MIRTKNNYQTFLGKKQLVFSSVGFEITKKEINPQLYLFQQDVVLWALQKGRACLFEDCGLGKTVQQLEWAHQVTQKEKAPVLIVAPLAVAEQTKSEGDWFGVDVNICTEQKDVREGVNITNYEKLHKFVGSEFVGIVLDESSILKSFSGVIRNQIIDMFKTTPYRLACTATPAPNDYMELGNHSEFLGVMTRTEMPSMFFINDTSNTGHWRLKGHVKDNVFWEWLSTWAVMI